MSSRPSLVVCACACLAVGSFVGAFLGSGLRVVDAQVAFETDELTYEEREQAFEELGRMATHLEQQGNTLKHVAKLVAPTVVHIEATKGDRFSARFGGAGTVEEAGSGVIIRMGDAYYVLTNLHVVTGTDPERIDVNLADGRQLHPVEVWGDSGTDVAVLKLDESNLIESRLGDSDQVEIGDFVLAVGSPFGLSRSVTFGIISAKSRRDLELGAEGVRYQDFLQTDAAINPGNSGGPLINLRGEVIGINTAIASNSGGNEGIGFTIPINMVRIIAEQLIMQGKVTRAFLGVDLDPKFTASTAQRLGLPNQRGARVTRIIPDSPAALANFREDDVVLRFNGIVIEDDDHLVNLVSLTAVGTEIPVVIFRDGKVATLKVRVGDRGEFLPRQGSLSPAPEFGSEEPELALDNVEAWDIDSLGVTVVESSDYVAQQLHARGLVPGLLVTRVDAAGASAGKISPGEVIERIGQHKTQNVDQLEAAMESVDLTAPLRIRLAPARLDTRSSSYSRIISVQPRQDVFVNPS